MFWPYSTFFQLLTDSHTKVEGELRTRLSERDSNLSALRAENEQLRMKLERMELALMPFSSQAGRAYAQSLSPDRPKPVMPARAVESMGWHETLQHHMQQEEIELTEAQKAAIAAPKEH